MPEPRTVEAKDVAALLDRLPSDERAYLADMVFRVAGVSPAQRRQMSDAAPNVVPFHLRRSKPR